MIDLIIESILQVMKNILVHNKVKMVFKLNIKTIYNFQLGIVGKKFIININNLVSLIKLSILGQAIILRMRSILKNNLQKKSIQILGKNQEKNLKWIKA